MQTLAYLDLFTLYDALAIGLILFAWLGVGWRIENPSKKAPSVSILMAEYRRDWLRELTQRGNRIYDAQILGTLRSATSFFASSTMIAMGGVAALLGNSDELRGVVTDLGVTAQSAAHGRAAYWELKLLMIGFFLVNAFLKFVWSNRLFGYCAVLMGSVPNDPGNPRAMPRALKAAEINIAAARSFNRGLRSIYFAIAATGWFLGPIGLLTATLLTCAILWRREFASHSRRVILEQEAD